MNVPSSPVGPFPSSPSRRGLLGAGLALGAGVACRAAGIGGPAERAAEGRAAEADAALDELFADLTDQRALHAPIGAAERAERRRRAGEVLRGAGLDALLVEPGPTLEYLCGVSAGRSERLFALVLTADGEPFWVLPSFEVSSKAARIDAAGAPRGVLVAWDEHEYAFGPLAAELEGRRIERLALEPSTRAFVAHGIEEAWGRRVLPGAGVVTELRGRKEPHELALLRAASELTQRAVVAVAERLRPGLSDHELGTWMRHAQERLGLRGTWVLPLLGAGAALPHGSAEGGRLERGEAILVDTGGGLHGYQSDTTRSWIFDGAPSAAYARAWNVVRDAQRAAYETLAPGVPCAAVDAAARRVMDAAGYGAGYERFTHRLGHGIGLEGHEGPYLDGGSRTTLAAGMTFSDEPGIYVEGQLGIRLEDIVVVTADGRDHFGAWQRSPLSPAS